MKHKLKIIPLVIFLFVFIAILGGLFVYYSTGIPEAIMPAQLNAVLIEKGLDPTDATRNAGEEMLKAGLVDCIIAEQNDIKFEYYNFDNHEAALNVYREAYKLIVRTKMGTPRIQIETGKFNYQFYSLDADGTYSVAVYVKNTAIYAYCNSENKHFLNEILDEIGYVEVEE